ncbi:MAG: hypothetical protein KJ626_09540 [Verrucomicrobia bacterium]|nr:hypothetical protein [Verrucomicrobiota bacterium]
MAKLTASDMVAAYQRQKQINELKKLQKQGGGSDGGGKKSDDSSNTAKGCGCGAIILLLIVGGIFVSIGEKFGCVATDTVLKQQVSVAITEITPLPEKDLLRVSFDVDNPSKWDIKSRIKFKVNKTTQSEPVAVNTFDAKVPAGRKLAGASVSFSLSDLKSEGIENPTDPDLCRITWEYETIGEDF